VLASANGGRAGHHIFAIGVARQGLEYTLENTAFAPSAEALARRLPIAGILRRIAPWDACAIPVNDGLDEQAIVRRGSTGMTLSPRSKILDPFPLAVPQCIAAHLPALQIAGVLCITQKLIWESPN